MSSRVFASDGKGDIVRWENKEDAARSADQLSLDEFENNFDPVEDKRILRKIDRHIIPLVSLLYLLSFLDRSNIGNAKIVGLVTDLKLKGLQYNVCSAVFFITYSAAEVPSNIALKLVRPSIWSYHTETATHASYRDSYACMTLMSQVRSYEGLIIARLFLGVTEAGLFPGPLIYLVFLLRRREQAFRVALFFGSGTVAGAFGGLLAAGLAKLDGRGGLQGWAWIFLVEGLFTVLVSIASYFLMQDYPATAKFLTESERKHVILRLRQDTSSLATHFDRRFIWQAFKDYKSYVSIRTERFGDGRLTNQIGVLQRIVAMYTGTIIPLSAFSLFLPSIITGLGYTAVGAQLMSVPPYVGGCITTLMVGWYSDKYHLRGPFIVVFAAIAATGYAIILGAHENGTKYAGAMIAALGVPTIPCCVGWAGNNVGGDLKRGVVLAMMIGITNLGGVCSSFVYMAEDAPRYLTGHLTVIGSLVMTIIMTLILMFDYNRLNKQKAAYCAREGIEAGREKEFQDLGDAPPLLIIVYSFWVADLTCCLCASYVL
ncbi:hypothetical protein FRB99_001142 [Tulasnella sp. 403]|nr:hypothetical protein FRB99_001142 [Tulasnella sp. 403]